MNTAAGLRILFAGTPDFAVPALRELVAGEFRPAVVFTQPDRAAGRGRQLRASPVKQFALETGIEVHQPVSLRDVGAVSLIASLKPDLMIVVAYGLLLPPEILEIPRHGCWNIHASLLPRWRGAAPIQRAIESGDVESGVCIMQMDAGLDTGPVIHRLAVPISDTETGGQLHDRLAEMGAQALLVPLRRLAKGESIDLTPQPEDGISYAAKLKKSEAQINWSEPAIVLERRIRAFNPWPVAWCMIGEERTRIWNAVTVPLEHSSEAGAVINASSDGIDVATGRQILRVLELQRPGKRRMSAADYLNAKRLPGKLVNSS